MIYVDRTATYPPEALKPDARAFGNRWCHLWSSTNDEAELLRFAARIKLPPRWLQRHRPAFLHFDLTPSRRRAALLNGAVEYSLLDWMRERFGQDVLAPAKVMSH